MRLSNVEIKNFRSIPYLKIDFSNHQAIGLVGINESGKSNILKALSFLDKEAVPNNSDIRIPRPDETESDTDAYVCFNFELSQIEIENLIDKLVKATVSIGGTLPYFTGKNGARSFTEFAHSRNIAQFYVDIGSGSKNIYTFLLDEEYAEIEEGWTSLRNVKNNSSLEVPWHEPKTIKLSEKLLLKPTDLVTAPDISTATPLSAILLDAIWQDIVDEYTKSCMPEAIFWSFEKENLLPASVPLNEFVENPATCKPLQRMFELAGVHAIGTEIEREKGRGRHRLNNLLNRVASRSSNHIRNVWKDYNPASIELQLDGEDIRIGVRDESMSFDLADRSDGFKRFITFLLMVSAKIRNNEKNNILLLIDEPEVSLHPAGIRNLRDELLELSKKNLVVYSTHSPQMIDPKCIDRHLVVRKISEVTTCEVARPGKYFDEEVLFNSLGSSIFEALKPYNFIFEGWRDKILFEVYRDNSRSQNIDHLRNCGTTFAQGVKDIRNIVPILTLANRKIVIITDHDVPALENQASFADARLEGTWKTYRELQGEPSSVTTAEDFIKPSALLAAVRELCKIGKIELKIDELEISSTNRLETIKSKLLRVGVKGDHLRKSLDYIKSHVFENLKPEDIEESYELVASTLNSIIAEYVRPEGTNIRALVVATG